MRGWLAALQRPCISSYCQVFPLLFFVNSKMSHIGKNWKAQPGQHPPNCPPMPSTDKSNRQRTHLCLLCGVGDIMLVTLNWEPRHSRQTSKFRKVRTVYTGYIQQDKVQGKGHKARVHLQQHGTQTQATWVLRDTLLRMVAQEVTAKIRSSPIKPQGNLWFCRCMGWVHRQLGPTPAR